MSLLGPGDERRPSPLPDPEAERAREAVALLEAATPRAWVTPAIAAILVACFAGEVALGAHPWVPTAQQLLRVGASFGPMLAEGQWWRLLTAGMLHAGLLHLGFNLWALWSAGRFAERIFGNLSYAVLYLLSAIGGSIFSAAIRPLAVSVGASGAIFGVYGALLAFALTHRGVFPPEVLRRQRNSLAGFLLYNVLFSLGNPSIDLAAHAGGLLVGLAAGWLLQRDLARPRERRGRRILGASALALALALGAWGARQRVEREPAVRAQRLADEGLAALRAGDLERAIERYTASLALRSEASSFHNRGLARLRLDRFDAGLADLSRALELSPGDPLSLRLRAAVLLQLGRLDEAARDCAALEKAPGRDRGPGDVCAAVARVRGGAAARPPLAPPPPGR